MPLNDSPSTAGRTFFGDPTLDDELPMVNESFWASLIGHIEHDRTANPRLIVDVGCHTGGLLLQLGRKFRPDELFGIEPLAGARSAAARRVDGFSGRVTLLDPTEWDRVPVGCIDLLTSHETLYLEPDLQTFMSRVRSVLSRQGTAYIVLGCHGENPLWATWKASLISAGHRVYDHAPLDIMQAASRAGLLPAVQPLRHTGWVSYDPLRAAFRYPDVRTMFEHHYRYKLIFRLCPADDRIPPF